MIPSHAASTPRHFPPVPSTWTWWYLPQFPLPSSLCSKSSLFHHYTSHSMGEKTIILLEYSTSLQQINYPVMRLISKYCLIQTKMFPLSQLQKDFWKKCFYLLKINSLYPSYFRLLTETMNHSRRTAFSLCWRPKSPVSVSFTVLPSPELGMSQSNICLSTTTYRRPPGKSDTVRFL